MIYCAPTASGKTIVGTAAIPEYLARGASVLFVCHRAEILDQTAKRLTQMDVPFGLCAAWHRMQSHRPVQIAMVGSLAARADNLDPDLMIFDECHHVAAPSWKVITHRWPKAKRLGLTATPARRDRRPLNDTFSHIVYGASHLELRELTPPALAEFRYFAPLEKEFRDKLAEVKDDKRTGDYANRELGKFMSGKFTLGNAVEHFRGLGGNRSALAFCANIEASRALVERLNQAGIPARHVDGSTSPSERFPAIHALKDKAINVLSSCEVFTEGLDLPLVDTIILMRPTHSVALFLQMIGRGMRPSGDTVQILDHAALVYEHDFPDKEREWGLDGASTTRKEGSGLIRTCPTCFHVHPNSGICPNSGHVYDITSHRDVEEVDATLSVIKETARAAYQPKPEEPAPEGCETIADFAERHGVSEATVKRWMAEGMPYVPALKKG